MTNKPKVPSGPARVVEAIDAYRCAINRGSEHGVSMGDRYIVYGLGREILDPETGESLGVLEIVRGRGKVTHVQPRLATLETYLREERPGKRIIKRNTWLHSIGGDQVEEIGDTIQTVFEGIETGDYAKPV
jgi:hypothetical protein